MKISTFDVLRQVMKKNIFFVFVFSLLITPLFAQKEAAIWYFGGNAGLDFNSGNPVALNNGKLITNEGCASISDKNGNILFYTDGSIVYDKTHQIMPNGYGLYGHKSSTQSAIIVPKPKNPYIYYIFTVDQPSPNNVDDNLSNDDDPPNNGLNYSVVDIRLHNGQGDVISGEKNIHLITYDKNNAEDLKFKCSEKITAVQHLDGISIWVITHFKNTFYSFKINTKGIEPQPVQTVTSVNIPTSGYISNAIGYLKASPNGKKIAVANTAIKLSNKLGPNGEVKVNTGNVLLYNFDAGTGKLSNQITLLNEVNPYGIEFSAKSKKLYVTENLYDSTGRVSLGSSLIQFDLMNSNSKIEIIKSNYVAGALQLAIDEKIYRAGYPNTGAYIKQISVINNPETTGLNCNFVQNAISLNSGVSQLGLPPFITSLFLYSFEYEFNCWGDTTHFFLNTIEKIDSAIWDFGDGTTSSSLDTSHKYRAPGEYKVTLTKTINGETREPIEKAITIYESPIVSTDPYKLVQCDTQDSNPLDGLATFNLEAANDKITLGNKEYDVFYYHSITDAENDTYNIKSIASIYRNEIPDEQIYAKVTQANSSCFKIGTIILQANKNNSIAPEALRACDMGDGKGLFNLDAKKESIRNELGLTSDILLFFYPSEQDASLSTNELKKEYPSVSKTIFIRAENSDGCYGTGEFDLIVESTPKLNVFEKSYICEGKNSSIILNSSIETQDLLEYTYLWSTGETTSSIAVTKEADYTVIVKNKAGCIETRTCSVTNSYLARIQNIIVHDLSPINEVVIEVANPDDYRYMIHFQNGTSTAFQDSPFFSNIPGGFHEIIVENKNGCGSISKNISVLEVAPFFTPNGDGTNDFWNVKGLKGNSFENLKIFIFDRYGKMLKQLNPSGPGWDGNYNTMPLPSDDYWFTIELENGREAKGHFSLKR